jgi:general secretion pathway protein D
MIVHSGQTVVLGGLILENRVNSRTRIPGLMDIPVLGGLFSSISDDIAGSELIITVTPRVIRNPYEYQQATEDLRKRVQRATAAGGATRTDRAEARPTGTLPDP